MAKQPKQPKKPKPALIGFGRNRPMPDEAGDTPPQMRVLDDEPEESDEKEDVDPFTDPNFDVLTDEIGKRFEVVGSLEEAGLQLTTQQVYDRLQAFYPSGYYSTRMVFDALRKMGFVFDDPYKDMNFVWLFK